MSTVQKINFEPVSSILDVDRRDFPLVDKTLADPLNSVALVDGEWMTIVTGYKMQRAAAITGNLGDPALVAAVRSFPLFAERGRTDVRAMADVKMPILWRGTYEFDTRIFDAAATYGNAGAAITTVMQPLKVATIAIGSRRYCGLVGSAYTSTDPIVGYVTRLPTENGGKLRFMSGLRA